MKHIKKLLLIAIFALYVPVNAQVSGLGIGVIVGEPTGLSLKAWSSRTTALDAGLAWSFSGPEAIHIHGDFLVHSFNLIRGGRTPLYYGVGGRIKLVDDGAGNGNGDSQIGVRVPFGIAHHLSGAPIDIFLEIVPVLDLVPDTDFDISGGIGIRIYP